MIKQNIIPGDLQLRLRGSQNFVGGLVISASISDANTARIHYTGNTHAQMDMQRSGMVRTGSVRCVVGN